MTITITGHRIRTRPRPDPDAPTTTDVPDEPTPAPKAGDGPADGLRGLLATTFDDTAWAATIGCRPVLVRRPR